MLRGNRKFSKEDLSKIMTNFGGFGKLLITFGVFLVITGLVVSLLGRYVNLGRLPGDILVKRGNFTFFFPVVTSIILSIVLSLMLNLLVRR
jgi:hypothetical protein